MTRREPVPDALRTPLALGEMGPDDWRGLAGLRGEHGMISMAVDYGLQGRSHAIRMLGNEMTRLRRRPPDGMRAAPWGELLAVTEAALGDAIAVAIGHGERSRAFFGAVGATDLVTVASPVRLPEFLAVGPSVRLTELALAAPASQVRGVVGVTRRRLTATEYWGPHPRAEWSIPLGADGDRRRREGPARGGPRRAIVHDDLVARGRGHDTRKALAEAARQLAGRAVARGWAATVVGGDMREVPAVVRPLADAGVLTAPQKRHVDSPAEQRIALTGLDRHRADTTRARLEGAAPALLRGAESIRQAIRDGSVGELFVGVRPPAAGRGPERVGEAADPESDETIRRAIAAGVEVSPVSDGAVLGVEPGALVGVGRRRADRDGRDIGGTGRQSGARREVSR